ARARTVRAARSPGALPVSGRLIETLAAWLLGVLWLLPLAYAVWTAFHPREYSARFVPTAPLTLTNFVAAWNAAPFARYLVKTVPKELDEAARVEGAGALQTLWKVYVPLARPVYVAYALVSVSYHWNNFLWPLIVTNSVTSRPLTVGLQVFSSTDQGVDWSI